MSSVPSGPRNPKVRTTGVVLAVLGVWCWACAIFGIGVSGAGPRVLLAVVGTVFVAVGAMLIRSRTPGLRAVRAAADGLAIDLVDGRRVVVPWSSVEWVRIRDLSPIFGGAMLEYRYADGAPRVAELGPFTRADGRALLGLPNDASAQALKAELRIAAGPKARPAGRPQP